MFDILIRVAIGIAAALAANEAVKLITGRSIPQHLMGLWNEINHAISEWAVANKDTKLANVVLSITIGLDEAISRGYSKIRSKVHANDLSGPVITERELSTQEVLELFPELAHNTVLKVSVA